MRCYRGKERDEMSKSKIKPNQDRHKVWTSIKRCRHLYLMVLPAIIAVLIFHYVPLYGIIMAFEDYKPAFGILGSKWVGLKHFKTFFEYPYFWKIMWNTIALSLWSFTTFPFPIIVALMLNEMRNGKLKKTCQTIMYAPHFVSTVVVCSMVLLFVGRDGIVNLIIEMLGGTSSDLMAQSSLFAPIYTVSGLWSGLGWGTILYTSALSSVSLEAVEAARIDGASRLGIIRYVYFPHIKPTIVTVFVMKIGTILSVGFEKIFLLQNPLNLDVSNVVSTYVYDLGLVGGRYSYSTAVGLFDKIISIILVVIANQITKKLSKDEMGLW